MANFLSIMFGSIFGVQFIEGIILLLFGNGLDPQLFTTVFIITVISGIILMGCLGYNYIFSEV